MSPPLFNPASGGGSLQFIERITVAGAAVNSVLFNTGINGDIDRFYKLIFRVFKAATLTELLIQPNSIATNQVSRRVTQQSSTTTFAFSAVEQPVAAGFAGGELFYDALTGRVRSYRVTSYLQTQAVPTQAGQFNRSFSGSWNDTITNITSFLLKAQDASLGIGIGSEFSLFRLLT